MQASQINSSQFTLQYNNLYIALFNQSLPCDLRFYRCVLVYLDSDAGLSTLRCFRDHLILLSLGIHVQVQIVTDTLSWICFYAPKSSRQQQTRRIELANTIFQILLLLLTLKIPLSFPIQNFQIDQNVFFMRINVFLFIISKIYFVQS